MVRKRGAQLITMFDWVKLNTNKAITSRDLLEGGLHLAIFVYLQKAVKWCSHRRSGFVVTTLKTNKLNTVVIICSNRKNPQTPLLF